MIDFGQSNTYTGKNELQPHQSTVKGPSYQGQALSYQKEKDKEALYQQNWEQFKEDSNISPEFIISDSVSKDISKQYNAFNDKWGKAVSDSPDHRLT